MFNIQSDGDKGVALGSLNGLAKMLALKYWRDKMCVCFGLGYLRKANKCNMRKNGQGSFVYKRNFLSKYSKTDFAL